MPLYIHIHIYIHIYIYGPGYLHSKVDSLTMSLTGKFDIYINIYIYIYILMYSPYDKSEPTNRFGLKYNLLKIY